MNRMAFMVSLLLSAGCGEQVLYRCTNDDNCTLAGTRGICVRPENVCALPASECTSGFRYDKTAGAHAEECVEHSEPLDMAMSVPDLLPPPASAEPRVR